MNRYHISYKATSGDNRTQGQNINAKSMINALTDFNTIYKGIKPIYIQDKGSIKTQ